MSDPNETKGNALSADLAMGVVMIVAFFAAMVFIRQDLALVYVGWCVLTIMLLRTVLPGSIQFRVSSEHKMPAARLRLPAVVAGTTALFLLVAAVAPAILQVVGMIVMIAILVLVVIAIFRGGF